VGVDALLLSRAEAESTGKAGGRRDRGREKVGVRPARHKQGDVRGGGGWGSGVHLR
jgi:hypothetical protein